MPNGSKSQILLVDDDPSVREALAMLLVSAGYDVTIAENGVHALRQLDRMLPDLIISDLEMPQMSGLELIARVKKQYPAISVIAMSGNYQGAAIPAGLVADRFYSKGENVHIFLHAITTLIANNTARKYSPSDNSASYIPGT